MIFPQEHPAISTSIAKVFLDRSDETSWVYFAKKTWGNCDIDDSFFNNDSQNSHRKVVGFKKCWNLSCEWCQSLLLSKEYTFKNVNKISTLKSSMSCNSFNVIYVVVCSSCLEEYILETFAGKTRLRDYVRVYRQHVKQPEHETF